jgi:hypothetical protein
VRSVSRYSTTPYDVNAVRAGLQRPIIDTGSYRTQVDPAVGGPAPMLPGRTSETRREQRRRRRNRRNRRTTRQPNKPAEVVKPQEPVEAEKPTITAPPENRYAGPVVKPGTVRRALRPQPAQVDPYA